ncbi:hypothetical protein LCGC14_1646680 [marine sediment metagenome]|uniref:Cupin type-2 domain-containing protein n=1 Tax=marine sediment metagenome TaxID=412755 RepID=A0A0F9KDW0_9ZZZZ
MKKENLKTIDKTWGEEIIIINDEYCSKLLILDRDAKSSYHYHKKKRETFYCIEGYATLTVEGKEYMLAPFTRPKTIEPGELHRFEGITQAVILEVSTHHEDEDVVRIEDSKEGGII